MTEMTAEKATALRKPFPPESIGRLPKGGQMLDFVGHAAVVDRLLAVDPHWSWEPFALDENGLPALDRAGNLWIRLTICGVTRIGVGDGKSAKECIGDALRNAAMRFGVALDLWAKENLVEFAQAAARHDRPAPAPAPAPPADGVLLNTSSGLAKAMFAAINEAGISADRNERLAWISNIVGRPIESSKDMLEAEARTVLDHLSKQATA